MKIFSILFIILLLSGCYSNYHEHTIYIYNLTINIKDNEYHYVQTCEESEHDINKCFIENIIFINYQCLSPNLYVINPNTNVLNRLPSATCSVKTSLKKSYHKPH